MNRWNSLFLLIFLSLKIKKVKEILFGKYKYQRKSDDEKLSIEIEIAPGLFIIVLIVVPIVMWKLFSPIKIK